MSGQRRFSLKAAFASVLVLGGLVSVLATLLAAGGLLEPAHAVAQQYHPPQIYSVAEEAFDGLLLKLAPAPLLERGPYRVLWAQWIGLPLVLLVSWLLGLGLARVTRLIATPIVRRTTTRWDDALLHSFGAPLTLAWTIIAAFFLVALLGLRPHPLEIVQRVLRAFWFATMFWGLARAVDIASQSLASSAIGPGVSARRALLPLIARAGRFIVMVFAFVALLSELGYSVASLIAGLGIGGLAVALAAQKTLEHWLGAVSIAVDQPFREGDFIKVGDVLGTVEQIGMRSTRVRTADRTVISIPNGKLADMSPETFSPRDRIRLGLNLKLQYGPSADQVQQVLSAIESALRAHPKLWPESITVALKDLADVALVIEVNAWFTTTSFDEFVTIRQGLLLEFMRAVEDAGARFAAPGQPFVEAAPEPTRTGVIRRG